MTRILTTPGGINPNPRSVADTIQNWQRLSRLPVNPDGTLTGIQTINLTLPDIYTGVVSSDGVTATIAIDLLNQNAHQFWAGPASGSPAKPAFRALTAADLAASPGAGTVLTSSTTGAMTWASAGAGSGIGTIGLTAPSMFTVGSSPLTANGTLTLALANQTSNTFLAGPISGSPAAPIFRGLLAADLATGGTSGQVLTLAGTSNTLTWATVAASGSVTAVGLSEGTLFTVGSSPVTTAGTITLTPINQTANTFYAGPTSGSPAAPTFRGIGALDLATGGSAGQVLTLAGTTNTLTWASAAAAGIGTLTLAVPAYMTNAGSPLSSSGTITIDFGAQATSQFFAGPTYASVGAGGTAAPSWRGLVGTDLALTGTGAMVYNNSTGGLQGVAMGATGYVLTAGTDSTPVWQPIGTATGWGTVPANWFFGGPASGGASSPGFRALLPTDICGQITMSPLVQNTSVLYSRTGTTATASSGTAASAIDGSQSTAWATTGNLSTSDFWKVNLGGTLSLGAVVLNYDVGGAAKWPASGTIGISLDDITYTTVASWATGVQAATGANPSNLGVNFEWTPAPAKFLKISSTANANAAGAATVWSMTEFSAWATTPQYRTYPDGASVTPVHYSPVTLVPGLGKRLTAKLAVYVPSFGTGLERAYAFYLGKDPTNCVGFEVFGGSAPHLLNYFNGTLLIDSNWNSVSSTNQLTIFDVEMYFSGSSPPSLLDPNILKVTCTAGSGTSTSNNMLVDTAHDFSLLSQINFMIGQQSGSTQKYVVASYIYGNTILP